MTATETEIVNVPVAVTLTRRIQGGWYVLRGSHSLGWIVENDGGGWDAAIYTYGLVRRPSHVRSREAALQLVVEASFR